MNWARLFDVPLIPWSQVLLLGKTDCVNDLNAPAAMYFVISVLPSSMTSGASPPASAASNFVRCVPQLWYWTSTSTPGCWALKLRVARATASGQPFCASFWSQTTILSAWAFEVPPLAVDAATVSMAARTAATRNRTFMSPSRSFGGPSGPTIGLDHQPRAGDWHRPLARVKS